MLTVALFSSLALAAPPAAGAPSLSPEAQEVKAELGLSVDALVAALPACELRPGDGALDLDRGCVDGACMGDQVPKVVAAFEATCTETSMGEAGKRLCDTDDGISFFDDSTLQRAPSSQLHAFYLSPDYEGRTKAGLGLGLSLACFVQELGTPTKVEIKRTGDRFVITELRFAEPKVWVQAEGGVVDRLVVYGSPAR